MVFGSGSDPPKSKTMALGVGGSFLIHVHEFAWDKPAGDGALVHPLD
jgi:hypothetical protein